MDVTAGARDVARGRPRDGRARHVHDDGQARRSLRPRAPKAPSPATTARSVAAAGPRSRRYYLGLMNCTRTGGWVTSTGKCSSPGGRNVAPLKLDSGISSQGQPAVRQEAGDRRLTAATSSAATRATVSAGRATPSYRWAENLGCRSGNPYAAVLGSHLFFQSEKSYNGGHYVNMMNAKYDRVGIGVWVSGGRVRLVIDFYHP